MNIKATFQGNDAEATAQFGEVQYGLAATVEVGDVSEGETAQVYNVGTAQNARLNFVLPRGKQGEPGKSAYELAVEQGFEGTLEDWYAKNGDTVILQQQVNNITAKISWLYSM